jgi:cell division protein FtsB
MVSRKRLKSVTTGLILYALAALMIGYFGVNAFTGNRGLKAREAIDQQAAELTTEIERLKADRTQWQRRVSLLKSDSIDPDMLDERARVLLDYAGSRDVILMSKAH